MLDDKRDLLFISHCMPWPLNKGEKIRAWNIIQHLQRNFRVHLGCVVKDPADMEHVERLRSVCASVGAFAIDKRRQTVGALLRARPGRPLMPDFYFDRALQRWVDESFAKLAVDMTYIYTVAMAPYVPQPARGHYVLDAIDVDSEKWAEYAAKSRFPMRAVWAREARALLAYERRAAALCERTFFVSEPEAARFRALAPEVADRIAAIELGVDLAYFSPESAHPWPFGAPGPCLVFTGNMDYWPNADAVIWFAHEVMPLLRAQTPGLRFWIVGANPVRAVTALAAIPGVHVTGRVSDVRPYVSHAAAVVCPLRIARGVQTKVLEGLAMGKPVIASSPAFEGVRARPGIDLLVADGAVAFKAAVATVLRGERPDLSPAARQTMETNYAWPAVLARLDDYLAV